VPHDAGFNANAAAFVLAPRRRERSKRKKHRLDHRQAAVHVKLAQILARETVRAVEPQEKPAVQGLARGWTHEAGREDFPVANP
jgi:hypothetical protein